MLYRQQHALGCLSLAALGFGRTSATPNTTLPSFVFDYGKKAPSIHQTRIISQTLLKYRIFSTTSLVRRSRNVFPLRHVRTNHQHQALCKPHYNPRRHPPLPPQPRHPLPIKRLGSKRLPNLHHRSHNHPRLSHWRRPILKQRPHRRRHLLCRNPFRSWRWSDGRFLHVFLRL